MFKERMTPDELARLTGYSRQTINKWVRKEGWTTSPKPGVQGGKARCIDSLEVRKKPGGHWIIRDLMGLDLVGLASL